MRPLVAVVAAPALVVGVLWPPFLPLALLVTLVVAVVLGAVLGSTRPSSPIVVSRMPTEHEMRRWGFGLGLGITFGGVFPFIYIRRRFR